MCPGRRRPVFVKTVAWVIGIEVRGHAMSAESPAGAAARAPRRAIEASPYSGLAIASLIVSTFPVLVATALVSLTPGIIIGLDLIWCIGQPASGEPIALLLLGIAVLVIIGAGVAPSGVAICLGMAGIRAIRQGPSEQKGKGLAAAGIVVGIMCLLASVLILLLLARSVVCHPS